MSSHLFHRDKASSFCQVCREKWSLGGDSSDNYFKCDTCEIITHGECRAIVKSCYPCEEHLYFLNSAKMAPYDCCQPGVVSVKLIQAYDLTVAQHTSLYGVIKLDGMEYNTCVAVSGEGDCVWTSSIVGNSGGFFGSSPSTPQHSESVPALTNTVSLKYNPSLYSIPSIASGSGSSASSTPKNSISGTGLRQSPKISLKLWSSVFGGLFDTTVAICQINAIPLFGHPNQIIERWFPLCTPNSNPLSPTTCGKVLLELKFTPDTMRDKTPVNIKKMKNNKNPVSLSENTDIQQLAQKDPAPEAPSETAIPGSVSYISSFVEQTNQMLIDATNTEDREKTICETETDVVALSSTGEREEVSTVVTPAKPVSSLLTSPVAAGVSGVGTPHVASVDSFKRRLLPVENAEGCHLDTTVLNTAPPMTIPSLQLDSIVRPSEEETLEFEKDDDLLSSSVSSSSISTSSSELESSFSSGSESEIGGKFASDELCDVENDDNDSTANVLNAKDNLCGNNAVALDGAGNKSIPNVIDGGDQNSMNVAKKLFGANILPKQTRNVAAFNPELAAAPIDPLVSDQKSIFSAKSESTDVHSLKMQKNMATPFVPKPASTEYIPISVTNTPAKTQVPTADTHSHLGEDESWFGNIFASGIKPSPPAPVRSPAHTENPPRRRSSSDISNASIMDDIRRKQEELYKRNGSCTNTKNTEALPFKPNLLQTPPSQEAVTSQPDDSSNDSSENSSVCSSSSESDCITDTSGGDLDNLDEEVVDVLSSSGQDIALSTPDKVDGGPGASSVKDSKDVLKKFNEDSSSTVMGSTTKSVRWFSNVVEEFIRPDDDDTASMTSLNSEELGSESDTGRVSSAVCANTANTLSSDFESVTNTEGGMSAATEYVAMGANPSLNQKKILMGDAIKLPLDLEVNTAPSSTTTGDDQSKTELITNPKDDSSVVPHQREDVAVNDKVAGISNDPNSSAPPPPVVSTMADYILSFFGADISAADPSSVAPSSTENFAKRSPVKKTSATARVPTPRVKRLPNDISNVHGFAVDDMLNPLPPIPLPPAPNPNPNRLCNVGKAYIYVNYAHKDNAKDAGDGDYYVLVEMIEGHPSYHVNTAHTSAAGVAMSSEAALAALEDPGRPTSGVNSVTRALDSAAHSIYDSVLKPKDSLRTSPGKGKTDGSGGSPSKNTNTTPKSKLTAKSSMQSDRRNTSDTDANAPSAQRSNIAGIEKGVPRSLIASSVLMHYDYRKTRTVFGSSTPIYNEHFEFNVPHYMYRIKLTLMDGINEKIIGENHFSIYSIKQRDADRFGHPDYYKMSNLEVEEVDIPLLDYNDSSNASAAGGSIGAISVSDRKWDDSATSGGSFADNRRRGGSDASVTANSTATSTSGSYIGYVRVQIRFEEDVESLYKNAEPLCVPPPPQEQISLERLRLHINRLGDLIAIFGDLQSDYNYLVSWKNPILTGSLFGIFLYMTFTLDAEYALCAPVLVLLAIMTYSMLQRKSGAYRQRWVEKGAKDLFKAAAAAKAATSAGAPANMLPSVSVAAPTTATPISEEDPFALLRVAVTGHHNVPQSGYVSNHADAAAYYVKISYLHSTHKNFIVNSSSNNSVTSVHVGGGLSDNGLDGANMEDMEDVGNAPNVYAAPPIIGADRESFIACAIVTNSSDICSGSHSGSKSARAPLPYHMAGDSGGSEGISANFSKFVRSSLNLFRNEQFSDGVFYNTADPWIRIRKPLKVEEAEETLSPGDMNYSKQLLHRRNQRLEMASDTENVDISYIYPVLQASDVAYSPADAKGGNAAAVVAASSWHHLATTATLLTILVHTFGNCDDRSSSILREVKRYLSTISTTTDSVEALAVNNFRRESEQRALFKWVVWLSHPGCVRFTMYKENPTISSVSFTTFVDTSIGYVDVPIREIVISILKEQIIQQQEAYYLAIEIEEHARAEARMEAEASHKQNALNILKYFVPKICPDKDKEKEKEVPNATPTNIEMCENNLPPREAPLVTETQQWYDIMGIADDFEHVIPKLRIRMSLDISQKQSLTPVKEVGTIEEKHQDLTSGKCKAVPTSTPPVHVNTPEKIDIARTIRHLIYEESKDSGGAAGTISAIWHMRSNIEYIQNLIHSVIDYAESVKNLLNWTIPHKTLIVYFALIAVWIATCVIPGRYLVLLLGLYEFLYAWFPEPKIFPWGIRLNNLIASMPNDADLDEIYSIEQKRFLKNEEMKLSKLYRSCILRYANECFWEGPVHMKGVGVMFQGSGGSGHANTVIAGNRNQSLAKDWIPVYLVVQGHRMVWWKVEDEITLAQSSVAQLLLYGLAGTTQPSPVDIRDVGDGSRMLAVFGRDISGSPQKFTVICKDSMECLKLMEALNQAVLSS